MADPLDTTNVTEEELRMQKIAARPSPSKLAAASPQQASSPQNVTTPPRSPTKPAPPPAPAATTAATTTAPSAASENKPIPLPSPPPQPSTETKAATPSQSPSQKSAPADSALRAAARRRMLARQALKSEFDFLAVPDWVRLHPLLGAYLAEATGTFLFVLTIALVTINNPGTKGRPDTNITPVPIGFMLMCMVFTFGYISGGHFNPAITFAVFLAGKMHLFRAIGYILSQCGAALGAGIVAMIIEGNVDIVVPDVQNSATYIRKGIFSELIYTFALATVVLNVAYSRQQGNFFYGFAIGMTVVAGSAAVGGVSGGAFNPAVATGLQAAVCLVGRCQPLLHFWLYWVCPLVGAGLATLLFKNLWQPEEPVVSEA